MKEYPEPLEYESHYRSKVPEDIEGILRNTLDNPVPFKEVNTNALKILGINKKIITCGCGFSEGNYLFMINPSIEQRVTYESSNSNLKQVKYDIAYNLYFLVDNKHIKEKPGIIKKLLFNEKPKEFDYLIYSTFVDGCGACRSC